MEDQATVVTPHERIAAAKTVLATSRDEEARAQAYADMEEANADIVAAAPDLSGLDAIVAAADAVGENAGAEARAMKARLEALFAPVTL